MRRMGWVEGRRVLGEEMDWEGEKRRKRIGLADGRGMIGKSREGKEEEGRSEEGRV